jgi:hypothetical protein
MSSHISSDVLTSRQLAFIAERLPEPSSAPRGRRPYSNAASHEPASGMSRCPDLAAAWDNPAKRNH